ncbi:hypothetical protein [Synechococcus sp. LTW-R]|uniref:hypothetical protein n=1 Tax=Synechococcus sp. LTW-R TaxID=2751170 RepID=UPI001627E1CB|nr:hypothetical protein [Synechococcus sp. LTW-R]QNG29751.1 hypothetical protein H0O22_00745 [Synechococcus sp. LTW-R]
MIKRATFVDGKKVPVNLNAHERMVRSAAMADACRSALQQKHLTPVAREMYEDSLLRHTQDWIRFKKQADQQAEK